MGRELPYPQSPQEQARKLMEQKSAIEIELEVHFSILKSNDVTMETPLVDREGFPRADVDIYAVRGSRKRIIELRNDLRAVMDDIQKALETIFAAPSSGGPVDDGEEPKPFARVDGVAPGSPASEAGLQREDLIVKFGGLTQRSFSSGSLQPLVNLVSASENRPISIDVLRSAENKSIFLTPRKGWGGRGMLGCHIVPYSP